MRKKLKSGKLNEQEIELDISPKSCRQYAHDASFGALQSRRNG